MNIFNDVNAYMRISDVERRYKGFESYGKLNAQCSKKMEIIIIIKKIEQERTPKVFAALQKQNQLIQNSKMWSGIQVGHLN